MTVALALTPAPDLRVRIDLDHSIGLRPEDRHPLVLELVTRGFSQRKIAAAIGTPRRTVRRDLAWIDEHLEEVLAS